MPKWYDNGTKKNKELSNKKLRKQEREWEDEKEWLERVLQKALQVPGISSDACTGSNLYPDFFLLPDDRNCNGIQKILLRRRYLGKPVERIW